MPVSSGGGIGNPADAWSDATRPDGSDVAAAATAVLSGTHGNAALKTLIDTLTGYVDTEVAAIKAMVEALIGSQTPTYTVDYGPTTLTTAAGVASWGSWTEVTAGSAGNKYIDSVAMANESAARVYYEIELATGAPGSEVIIASFRTPLLPQYGLDRLHFKRAVSLPASTRLSARCRNMTDATARDCSLLVNLRGG